MSVRGPSAVRRIPSGGSTAEVKRTTRIPRLGSYAAMSHQQFFESAWFEERSVTLLRRVVALSQRIISLGTQKHQDFVPLARIIASTCEELTQVLTSQCTSEDCFGLSNQHTLLLQEFTLQSGTEVQTQVLEVVKSAKAVLNNPQSFIAAQAASSSVDHLSEHVNDLLTSLYLLAHPKITQTEGDDDNSFYFLLLQAASAFAADLQKTSDAANEGSELNTSSPAITALYSSMEAFIAFSLPCNLGDLSEKLEGTVKELLYGLRRARKGTNARANNQVQKSLNDLAAIIKKIVLSIVQLHQEMLYDPEQSKSGGLLRAGGPGSTGDERSKVETVMNRIDKYNSNVSAHRVIVQMSKQFPWFEEQWIKETPDTQLKIVISIAKRLLINTFTNQVGNTDNEINELLNEINRPIILRPPTSSSSSPSSSSSSFSFSPASPPHSEPLRATATTSGGSNVRQNTGPLIPPKPVQTNDASRNEPAPPLPKKLPRPLPGTPPVSSTSAPAPMSPSSPAPLVRSNAAALNMKHRLERTKSIFGTFGTAESAQMASDLRQISNLQNTEDPHFIFSQRFLNKAPTNQAPPPPSPSSSSSSSSSSASSPVPPIPRRKSMTMGTQPQPFSASQSLGPPQVSAPIVSKPVALQDSGLSTVSSPLATYKVSNEKVPKDIAGCIREFRKTSDKLYSIDTNLVGKSFDLETLYEHLSTISEVLKQLNRLSISRRLEVAPSASVDDLEESNSRMVGTLLSEDLRAQISPESTVVMAVAKEGMGQVTNHLQRILNITRISLQGISMQVVAYATVLQTPNLSQSTEYWLQVSIMRYLDVVKQYITHLETYNCLIEDFDETDDVDDFRTIQQKFDLKESLNIWDSKSAQSVNRLEGSSEITKGSLNDLIVCLTDYKSIDTDYNNAFFCTYKSFATPLQILQKLVERFNVPSHINAKDSLTIKLRVLISIKEWAHTQFEDFDQALINRIFRFISTLKSADPGLKIVGDQVAAEINSKINSNASETVSNSLFCSTSTIDKFFTNLDTNIQPFDPTLNFLEVDSLAIAKMLTIVDFKIFASIKPSELLRTSWSKPETRHQSPHISLLIHRLNRLTFWVATSILCQDTIKKRSRTWSKFIEIAQHLRTLNNFNSLMGIIAAINMSAIQRLNHTKNTLKKKEQALFLQLETLMSPHMSWKEFRTAAEKAILPAMPYLGVYLTDITFIEDGNKDFVDGQINFAKRRLQHKIISTLLKYQQVAYTFPPDNPAYTLVYELPSLNEDQLYQLSLKREPRKSELKDILNQERERERVA